MSEYVCVVERCEYPRQWASDRCRKHNMNIDNGIYARDEVLSKPAKRTSDGAERPQASPPKIQAILEKHVEYRSGGVIVNKNYLTHKQLTAQAIRQAIEEALPEKMDTDLSKLKGNIAVGHVRGYNQALTDVKESLDKLFKEEK